MISIDKEKIATAIEAMAKNNGSFFIDNFENSYGIWDVFRRWNDDDDEKERLVFAKVDVVGMEDEPAPLVHRQFKMAAMTWLADNEQVGNVQVVFDSIVVYILNEHRAFVQWSQNIDFSKEEN